MYTPDTVVFVNTLSAKLIETAILSPCKYCTDAHPGPFIPSKGTEKSLQQLHNIVEQLQCLIGSLFCLWFLCLGSVITMIILSNSCRLMLYYILYLRIDLEATNANNTKIISSSNTSESRIAVEVYDHLEVVTNHVNILYITVEYVHTVMILNFVQPLTKYS